MDGISFCILCRTGTHRCCMMLHDCFLHGMLGNCILDTIPCLSSILDLIVMRNLRIFWKVRHLALLLVVCQKRVCCSLGSLVWWFGLLLLDFRSSFGSTPCRNSARSFLVWQNLCLDMIRSIFHKIVQRFGSPSFPFRNYKKLNNQFFLHSLHQQAVLSVVLK